MPNNFGLRAGEALETVDLGLLACKPHVLAMYQHAKVRTRDQRPVLHLILLPPV